MRAMTQTYPGLPDPDAQPEFYDDTPTKRAIAWAIDTALVFGLWLVLTVLSAGLLVWLLPFFAVVDFLYRTTTISRRSATWGMRAMSIELRDRRGEPLDFGQAVLHTAGYMASIVTLPVQIVSGAMMLATPRRQGLTDHVMGTAAVNRAAL